MSPLVLKVGIMTPVLFLRMADRSRAEVAFQKQRGIAVLPEHIRPDDLKFGRTLLDVEITHVSSCVPSSLGPPPVTFEADALNVIGPDMLALMRVMHEMFEGASDPRSAALEELKKAVGKNRVEGTLLGIYEFNHPQKGLLLEVVVGYRNLRARGLIHHGHKEDLEYVGIGGKVSLEILAVNPDEKDLNNFRASVFINARYCGITFVIGWEGGSENEVLSSREIIDIIMRVLTSRSGEEIHPADDVAEAADRLVDFLENEEYGKAAKYLLDNFSAEQISNILTYYYYFMEKCRIFERDDYLFRILDQISERSIGILRQISDHLSQSSATL